MDDSNALGGGETPIGVSSDLAKVRFLLLI
jgi:hypothetical protein